MIETSPSNDRGRTLVADATGAAQELAAVVAPLFGGTLPVRVRAWDGSVAGPVGAPTLVVNDPAALRRLLYRPDRLAPPVTGLPVSALDPDDGWCDDPADAAYYRPVRPPFAASHERM